MRNENYEQFNLLTELDFSYSKTTISLIQRSKVRDKSTNCCNLTAFTSSGKIFQSMISVIWDILSELRTKIVNDKDQKNDVIKELNKSIEVFDDKTVNDN